MQKKIIILILCIFSFLTKTFAQKSEQKPFAVSGVPVVSIFTNYHTAFGEKENISGFEMNRAYLGYEFKLHPNLTGRVVVDFASGTSEKFLVPLKRDIYMKNAMLIWEDKKFTITGGLIYLLQFRFQEKFWGYRYIAPVFQDVYKMGHSADLGASVEYKFSPWLSADFSITNGEGYKSMNADNKQRYGLGTTLKLNKGIVFRIYGDISQQSEKKDDQQSLAIFGGYKTEAFSLGLEYNYQKNNLWYKKNDYYGYSVYSTIPIDKKWKIFGRFDDIKSENADGNSWSSYTGEMLICGIEFNPIERIKIAPNYRYTRSLNPGLLTYSTLHSAYINVMFNW